MFPCSGNSKIDPLFFCFYSSRRPRFFKSHFRCSLRLAATKLLHIDGARNRGVHSNSQSIVFFEWIVIRREIQELQIMKVEAKFYATVEIVPQNQDWLVNNIE